MSTPPIAGMDRLRGAVDSHVHCCPHINDRTVSVFDATRQAAAAGMKGLGLMDVFANSSGLAALAMRELGHLGVDVFGGIVLEAYAGGLSARVVATALDRGYGPGTGARFVSLPLSSHEDGRRSGGAKSGLCGVLPVDPGNGSSPRPPSRNHGAGGQSGHRLQYGPRHRSRVRARGRGGGAPGLPPHSVSRFLLRTRRPCRSSYAWAPA